MSVDDFHLMCCVGSGVVWKRRARFVWYRCARSTVFIQFVCCVSLPGKFGNVFKVKRKTGPGGVYAMKVIKKCDLANADNSEQASISDVLREVHIMQMLQHPFIVQLLASFQSRDRLFIVMPFLSVWCSVVS